jgi:hypothetical protein
MRRCSIEKGLCPGSFHDLVGNYPQTPLALLPLIEFVRQEPGKVIRQAYKGLYELVAPMVFDKYLDFIDIYAGIA